MNSFVALVAVVCMCGQAYGGWTEVWRDDFNGNSLDQNNWKLETGTGQNGWGNGEMEYYTNGQNLQVQNGVLTITARVEDVENSHFTSSRLNSRNAWAYGKFEVRARLPKGKNLWPAIWLFPQSNTYGGWAASGEIDISEVRGEQPTISQSTLHYGAQWPQNQYSGSGPVDFGFDFSQDYHVFGAEWTNASIKFLVDDKEFHTENIDRNMSSGAPYTKNGQPFDQPFFWILNVAVGGQFFPSNEYGPAVTPDEARQWPKPTMEIDYVRVSQWQ